MKELVFSIRINQPRDLVFNRITDKTIYPDWAKAWGEGMSYEGEWQQGEHISFFDQKQGGTRVVIEELVPNELIRARHIAMVNPQNEEVALTDDMMRKWIGSTESYYFKKVSENETVLEIVMVTDPVFEDMMGAWNDALKLFKELCEAK